MAVPANNSDVIFLSYNSTGFNSQRAQYLTELTEVLGMSRCLVSLQEHFIMKRNLTKIANLLPSDYVIFNVAAFKDCDQIRRGRVKRWSVTDLAQVSGSFSVENFVVGFSIFKNSLDKHVLSPR